MLFKKYSRPFDPTGSSVLNLVLGEIRPVATADERIFIPSHGPYYTASLVVMSNGNYLVKGIDYQPILIHKEASRATAKEVGCGVRIYTAGLTEVSIDYQCVGGQYQSVYAVLKSQIEGMGSSSTLNPVKYNEIVGRPERFNSAAHYHPYWEFDGWGVLIPKLDRIKNGILSRKRKKTQELYDYFDVKQLQFTTSLNSQINQMSLDLRSIYDRFRDPVGTIRLSLSGDNTGKYRDGSWNAINDQVLFKTATNSLLGVTVGLSEEIVYPQPDNILLDESDVPIMRDDDEWMYLDNQFPVLPSAGNGGELVDVFNLLYVKGHTKVAMGNQYSAAVTSSLNTINEGDSVTFTLTTFKYAPGLVVPYQILGVNNDNITIPRIGAVTLGNDGKANLTLTLVQGGPRTDQTDIRVAFMIHGEVFINVPYVLASNDVKTVQLGAFVGLTEVKETSHTLGDRFYLRIDPKGLKGKVVRVSGFFDGSGTHQLWMNGVQANGVNGGYREFTIPSDSSSLWVEIHSIPTSDAVVTTLNFNVTYNSVALGNLAVPAKQLSYSAVWIDPTNNQEISSIVDDRPFQLKITHNAKQVLSFPVTVAENTLGSELNPTPNTFIQSNLSGTAYSQQFMANRNDRSLPDHLTLWIRNPYVNSLYLIKTMTIPVAG